MRPNIERIIISSKLQFFGYIAIQLRSRYKCISLFFDNKREEERRLDSDIDFSYNENAKDSLDTKGKPWFAMLARYVRQKIPSLSKKVKRESNNVGYSVNGGGAKKTEGRAL